jgi:3-hydroxyisobutyrate dehydrogenase-like beta-hydroxyacid dehydrogenase
MHIPLTIGFLELSVAGFSMAGNLAEKGYKVKVYDSHEARAVEWAQRYGGEAVATPALAAQGSHAVIACSSNESALHRMLVQANGALTAMVEGSLLIDHSLISTSAAQTIFELCQQCRVDYLDCAYFGGQREAREARLTVMAGGEKAAFDRARPILNAYAKYVALMGGVGAGLRTRLVGQVALSGLLKGFSDALAVMEKEKLHSKLAMDVVSHALAEQIHELANLVIYENEVVNSQSVK